jgi:hypothetical protein
VSEAFEVCKYGYSVPLAEGTCQTCGRPVMYNLGHHPGILLHVDDGEPNNCGNPWPARKIEKPQIDSAALEGVVASATTQDAPKAASVAYVPRAGGTDATVTLAEWDAELAEALGVSPDLPRSELLPEVRRLADRRSVAVKVTVDPEKVREMVERSIREITARREADRG